MKSTTWIFMVFLFSIAGCSKDTFVSDSSPSNRANYSLDKYDSGLAIQGDHLAALGCHVHPPGIVKALSRSNEVEILESNSDFINHIYLVSPVEMFIATDDDWGAVVALPDVKPNEELVFEIRVHDPGNNPTGVVWQTGPGSRNADGAVHAIIMKCPMRAYEVHFEDIDASGWEAADEPNYVDAIFAVRPR